MVRVGWMWQGELRQWTSTSALSTESDLVEGRKDTDGRVLGHIRSCWRRGGGGSYGRVVAEAVDGWRKVDDGGRMADGGVMAEDRYATYGRKGWRIEMFVAREAVEVLPEKRSKVLPEKRPKELAGKLSDGSSAK